MEASQLRTQQDPLSDLRPCRWLPQGADVLPQGGVHFRVWASRRQHIEVILEGGPGYRPGAEPISIALEPEGDGYFSGLVPEASAGTLYRYRLDGGTELYPDAASRFQPHGPDGPSQVIDPGIFQWHDQGWCGVPLEGQVIYEIYVGTFTPIGTWEAAIGELPVLAEVGVTVLEIMPIADFAGRFGWSYDGVNLFAPTRLYGTPDDCRRFIDQAHALGLGVILDSDLYLTPAPEPLLPPPEGMDWIIMWSSEDPRYGGDGVIPLEDEGNWYAPSHTATVLRPHTRQGQEA